MKTKPLDYQTWVLLRWMFGVMAASLGLARFVELVKIRNADAGVLRQISEAVGIRAGGINRKDKD